MSESAPPHKPLLLPGIAPHLFPTQPARRPLKTSGAHPSSARRTAEARIEAQAAQIAHLQATVDTLTSQVHTTADLYHNAQRQLLQATLHLGTIIAVYAESKNERGLEGALVAAREFWKESKLFFHFDPESFVRRH
jgi:small-conductance mechanosensitive channel